MKKRFSILIAMVLCLCMALAACSSFPNAKVADVPDSSYAVMGNGGLSVQQGRYIYFVNGYAEIEDADGKNNEWGKVVKGGIARIDMTGGRDVTATSDLIGMKKDGTQIGDPYLGYYGEGYKTVVAADVPGVKEGETTDYSGFDMTTEKDTEDKEYAAIKSTMIVPKKVSNGKSENGGISIFENWIYYTTPLAKRNKAGEVQYKLTAFMRTRLNGTGTEVLYETSDAAAALKYGYYRYGGKTYLTVLDGTDLKSVTCKDGGGKGAVYTLATDVKDALFSNKPIYFNGMREDTIEDFVYYTKDAGASDENPNGSVLHRVRPNGKQGLRMRNSGQGISLKSIANGYLYYTAVNPDSSYSLYGDNLGAYPTEPNGEASGKSDVFEFDALGNYSTLFVANNVNSFDAQTKNLNVSHYALVGRSGQTELISGKDDKPIVVNQLDDISVIKAVGDTVYYYSDNRTNIAENPKLEVVVEKINIHEGFPVVISEFKAVIGEFMIPDISAGYLVYASVTTQVKSATDKNTNANREVSGYMHVRRVDGFGDNPSSDVSQVTEPEWFAGIFAPSDLKDVEKTEESETE